jgi:hypothetical protein
LRCGPKIRERTPQSGAPNIGQATTRNRLEKELKTEREFS